MDEPGHSHPVTMPDEWHAGCPACDAAIETIADHIMALPLSKQVAVVMGILEAVTIERDRLRAAVEQALNLGEDEGMQRGKTPYPDWWVLLDRALVPRHRSDGSVEATDDEHHDHCNHDPIKCSFDVLADQYQEAVAERDRLRAVVDHLRDSAESAIVQDRDDEYDEGNRGAWLYVRNVLDGRVGPANALGKDRLDVSAEATDG